MERKKTEMENVIYYKGRAPVTEAWEGMEIEIFAYLIGWKLTLSYFSVFSSPPVWLFLPEIVPETVCMSLWIVWVVNL